MHRESQEQLRVDRLERAAPTPSQEGIMVTLQWLGSGKVSGHVSDLTNALGQARKTSRKNKLATGLLPGVTHPAVGPRELLLVETEIYVLVSGPSWLRASLTVDLLAAGYVKNRTTNVCSPCSPAKTLRKVSC